MPASRRDPTPVAQRCGAVAQLGERLNGIQEVRGSTPLGSTIFPSALKPSLQEPARFASRGATFFRELGKFLKMGGCRGRPPPGWYRPHPTSVPSRLPGQLPRRSSGGIVKRRGHAATRSCPSNQNGPSPGVLGRTPEHERLSLYNLWVNIIYFKQLQIGSDDKVPYGHGMESLKKHFDFEMICGRASLTESVAHSGKIALSQAL